MLQLETLHFMWSQWSTSYTPEIIFIGAILPVRKEESNNKCKQDAMWLMAQLFLQFFESMMTLFYLVGKCVPGWCSFVFQLFSQC